MSKYAPHALLLALAFVTSSAHASGGGHAGGPGELVWPAVNFLTYVLLLYFVLRRPLAQALEARHSTMVTSLKRASELVAEATKDLNQAQGLLARVDDECARISSEIERDAATEAAQIVDDAKARAARVLEQAKKNAESERKATLEAIRREVAELVLQKAEARLIAEIGTEQDRTLRSTVIRGVGALH